jgi:hypothetical protein
MSDYFVVKVQASLETTHDQQQVMVYDEHRTFQHEGPLGADISRRLNGRPKVYFWAYWLGQRLIISTEAPAQHW